MQIVIDIEDEVYDSLLHFSVPMLPYVYPFIMANAIANGKVLPKEHGDLIDRSKLKIVNLGIGDYDVWGVEDCDIADAPTVIPADK